MLMKDTELRAKLNSGGGESQKSLRLNFSPVPIRVKIKLQERKVGRKKEQRKAIFLTYLRYRLTFINITLFAQ